jgi:hypothetical protein
MSGYGWVQVAGGPKAWAAAFGPDIPSIAWTVILLGLLAPALHFGRAFAVLGWEE